MTRGSPTMQYLLCQDSRVRTTLSSWRSQERLISRKVARCVSFLVNASSIPGSGWFVAMVARYRFRPRPFNFWSFFSMRRPEAVAKTEILERLWPETFVADSSLHNLVTEVRAALGDSPQTTRYIRTVPRYGYAFQAVAQPVPSLASSGAAPPGPRLVSRHREWRLSEGANLVGRDRDCVVRIDSVTLSRRHARIVVTRTETTVEDLGSKNGTVVNGTHVKQPVTLRENDEIQLGSVRVIYRVQDTLPSDADSRPEAARQLGHAMDAIFRELRHGVQQLLQRPVFPAAAIRREEA